MNTINIVIQMALIILECTLPQYAVAHAIAGERPDLACSTLECERIASELIGDVILNRLEAGWCADIVECATVGFHGTYVVDYPDWDNVQAAKDILAEGGATNSIFYVFSRGDIEKLGIAERDIVVVVGDELPLFFCRKETTWQ